MTSMLTTNLDIQQANTCKLSRRTDDLRRVMDSGGARGSYSEIPDAGKFIETTAALKSTDSDESNCKTLLSLQQFTVTQLEAVKRINTAFNKVLRQCTTSNPLGSLNFQGNINSFLTQLTNVLNTRFGEGINPLSGTATNRDAVVNLAGLGALGSGAGVDTSYYTGNNATQTFALDDSNTISLFQVNATNPAIEKLIRALRISLGANPSNPTDPSLAAALTLSDQVATTDIGNAVVQASLQVDIIKSSLENVDTLRVSLAESLQDGELADFYKTLKDLEEARANLEISEFLMMQEIQDLQDFLNGI